MTSIHFNLPPSFQRANKSISVYSVSLCPLCFALPCHALLPCLAALFFAGRYNAHPMIWKPHVTVAAVIEDAGRFLLVEEQTEDGLRFNQPAGHLDEGESLITATIRETLEETAHHFQPTALIGIYRWQPPGKDLTYLRMAFTGELGEKTSRALDTGIVRTVWMSADEIRANHTKLRSPLVLRCVEDYLAGKRFPIDLLHDVA